MADETFLLYCDDSGDDYDSYWSAVAVPMGGWTSILEEWLKFRQWLYSKYGVPARYELHAYAWIMAKDDPLPDDPTALINTSKGLRQEITIKALKAIKRAMAAFGAGVITCHHPGAVKSAAYQTLIATVDAELARRGDWALMIGDGSPQDPDLHILQAHRALPLGTRRIVEDGWIQHAHASQFLQIADLIAHCAHQTHLRAPARKFMWDWYPEHVHDLEWTCVCP